MGNKVHITSATRRHDLTGSQPTGWTSIITCREREHFRLGDRLLAASVGRARFFRVATSRSGAFANPPSRANNSSAIIAAAVAAATAAAAAAQQSERFNAQILKSVEYNNREQLKCKWFFTAFFFLIHFFSSFPIRAFFALVGWVLTNFSFPPIAVTVVVLFIIIPK